MTEEHETPEIADRKTVTSSVDAAAKTAAAANNQVESRIAGTEDQRTEAAKRAEECSKELDAVLQKHRCRIVPVLSPQIEMISSGQEPGYKGIVSCTYGVAPNV